MGYFPIQYRHQAAVSSICQMWYVSEGVQVLTISIPRLLSFGLDLPLKIIPLLKWCALRLSGTILIVFLLLSGGEGSPIIIWALTPLFLDLKVLTAPLVVAPAVA